MQATERWPKTEEDRDDESRMVRMPFLLATGVPMAFT
jgi:hypothetical protein